MTTAGQLNRRVIFSQRSLDGNGDRLGPFVDVATCFARVQPLKGGEAVQQQRVQGLQPVIITVRQTPTTKTIDNGFEARDAQDATIRWDVQSVILTEDRQWVEVMAVQRRGGR